MQALSDSVVPSLGVVETSTPVPLVDVSGVEVLGSTTMTSTAVLPLKHLAAPFLLALYSHLNPSSLSARHAADPEFPKSLHEANTFLSKMKNSHY